MKQINIVGDVGMDITPEGISSELQNANGDDIQMYINSGGGSVLDGIAIYNAIRNYQGSVTAEIDFAASMATYIMLAADEIHMADNGYLMIHNPWGMVAGDAQEMQNTAALLMKMQDDLLNRCAQKTGMSAESIQEMMDNETWMNAQEAFDMGFVDVINEGVQMVAQFKDKELRDKLNNLVAIANDKQETKTEAIMAEETKEDAKSVFAKLGSMLGFDKDVAEAVAELEPQAKADIKELVARIESLEAKYAEVEAKEAKAEALMEEAEQVKEQAEQKVEEANFEVEQAEKEAEEALAKKEEAEKALASLDKGFVGESSEDSTVYETYKGLKGAEKNAFFKAR